MKIWAIVVVLMVLIAGCGAEDLEREWTPTEQRVTFTHTPAYEQRDYEEPDYPNVNHHKKVDTSNVEDEIVEEINFERGVENLPRVVEDERLSNIARNYSMTMAKEGFFDHKEPDGDLPTDRLDNHDYHCAGLQEILAKSGYGIPVENDQGTVRNVTTEQGLAEDFLSMWLRSNSHRKAIMWKDAITVGAGVYVEPNGTAWATVIFCSKLSR